MARCQDCAKFVSYGDMAAEVISEDILNNVVYITARIVLTCAECSSELKEAELECELDIEHECGGKQVFNGEQFELLSVETTPNERQQTTGRRGQKMSPRSWKQFYGADIDVNVKCLKCGEAIDLTGDVEEQASYFTEVY